MRTLYTTEQLLEKKKVTELPEEVWDNIHLISLPGSTAEPFGSFFNRSSREFGDIDLIQQFVSKGSSINIAKKVAGYLKNIVVKIAKSPTHYFSELKCGIDERYEFDIGNLVNGIYYPSDSVFTISANLFDNGLLPEYPEIMNIIEQAKDANSYDKISEIFREKYTLRWTASEIIRGWKYHYGSQFSLWECILMEAPLKLDMITMVSGRFIEITNFMGIARISESGLLVPLNIDLEENLADANEQLKSVIEELYYSDMFYNPFKLVKRAISVLKSSYSEGISGMRLNVLIQNYFTILGSTINILYTIKSELDAIHIVLSRNFGSQSKKTNAVRLINKRLSELLTPLSNVLEINGDELENLSEDINVIISEKNPKSKASLVKEFMSTIAVIINYHTIDYFNKTNLNPPPACIMPKTHKYNRKIIRTPTSDPGSESISGGYGNSTGGIVREFALKAFNKLANKYRERYCEKSRPLYEGELHYGCHNFTGPGTNMWRPEVRAMEPINDIDACSKQHDLDYMYAVEQPEDERKRLVREADERVIECYNRYPGENGYNVAKLGINSKMAIERVLPMVAKSVFGRITGGVGQDLSGNYDSQLSILRGYD